MTNTAERYTPNPEIQQRYQRLYQEVFQSSFPTLQALLNRLSELTHHEL